MNCSFDITLATCVLTNNGMFSYTESSFSALGVLALLKKGAENFSKCYSDCRTCTASSALFALLDACLHPKESTDTQCCKLLFQLTFC